MYIPTVSMLMRSPPLPTACGGIGVTTLMAPVGAGDGLLIMRGVDIIPVTTPDIGVATGGLIGDTIMATIPDGAEATGRGITLIPIAVLMARYAQVEVRGLPEVPIFVARILIPHARKEQPLPLLPAMTAV